MTEPEYPECRKMSKVVDQSRTIGEFLDWLKSGEADNTRFKRPITLAATLIIAEDRRSYGWPPLEEDEWYLDKEGEVTHWNYDTERLLAKFFGIDLNKVDTEKRAMIEAMRKEHNAKKTTTGG